MRNVFTHILTMFTNLKYLKLGPTLCWYQQLSFKNSHSSVVSSTLLELHVYVPFFTDCLDLLDGRFPCRENRGDLDDFEKNRRKILINRISEKYR
jgi:hypothetical protein